jgi:fluoride exporter
VAVWLQQAVAVALGGAAGAVARFGCVGLCHQMGWGVPWVIMGVNALGCFAFGVLHGALAYSTLGRAVVLTGLLGGFTTFSSYVFEAHQQPSPWVWLVLSPLVGYAAFVLGQQMAYAVGH